MNLQRLIFKPLFVALTFSFFLYSCKKDKDVKVEPELKIPVVKISSPTANSTMWNTILIEINVTDADKLVNQVRLYANDILVGAIQNAPFQFEWNTKDVEDGEVKLKVVALSEEDEELSFDELSFNVMNTLIHYKIAQNTISFNPEAKHFTYITNENREVLYFKQIEELPFETIVMRPDNFNDEKITVHMVEAIPSAGKLTTFNDVVPGLFSPVVTDEKGEETGKAKITFTDVPAHIYFTANNLYGEELNENTISYKTLYQNQNLLYVYFKQDDKGIYKIENNLIDGDNMVSMSAISLGEMTLHNFVENGKIINDFDFQIDGHLGTSATSPSARIYRKKVNIELESLEFDFHTPTSEASFDHYSSYIRLFDGEKTFIQRDYFNILTGINKLDVNFDVQNRKLSEISVSASGASFDVLKTTYAVYGIDDFMFYWENYSKDDNIIFPPFPTELTQAIKGLSNSNLGFVEGGLQMEVTEYQHIDGYTNFINRLFGRNGLDLLDGATTVQNTIMEFPVK